MIKSRLLLFVVQLLRLLRPETTVLLKRLPQLLKSLD
jgi:hypothetical protein